MDNTSFKLIACPAELSMEDFYTIQKGDEESGTEVCYCYYEEVPAIIKENLKCDKVICFHH